jgi:thymidylate kinase
MKLCIIGAHGTGKSTLTMFLSAYARLRGKNCVNTSEVARDCPFPLNDGFGSEGAHWIIHTQIQRELKAKASGYEDIFCDRSSIDPIMYLKAKNIPEQEYRNLRDHAEKWMDTYDMILCCNVDYNIPIFKDGVRHTDNGFRRIVEKEFLMFIEKYNFDRKEDKKIRMIDSANILYSQDGELLHSEISALLDTFYNRRENKCLP